MKEIEVLLTKFNKVHLARELGVTRATIYNYVNGIHKPSLDVYLKIQKLIEYNGLSRRLKGGETNRREVRRTIKSKE